MQLEMNLLRGTNISYSCERKGNWGLGVLLDRTQTANDSDELIQFSMDLICD